MPHSAIPPLTTKTCAHWYQVCPKTIRCWIKTGRLPAFRVGKKWLIAPETINKLGKIGATP